MPIRRLMAPGSATDVPPNFITTLTVASLRSVGQVGRVGRVGQVGRGGPVGWVGNSPPAPSDRPALPAPPARAISQQPLAMHQLGIQDRGAGRAADRVVAEREELVV